MRHIMLLIVMIPILAWGSLTGTDRTFNYDVSLEGVVKFNALTATTVPYLDASKDMVSSAVTPTELGYVSGVTSAIQTQLDAKASTTLNNLGTTSINSGLLPNSPLGQNIGSATLPWNTFSQRVSDYYSAASTLKGSIDANSPVPPTSGGAAYNLALISKGTAGSAVGVGVWSADEGTADGNPTGSIKIETGDKTAGTGDSGSILFQTGTSAGGTRGTFNIKDGSEGSTNECWVSTGTAGEGNWDTCPGGGGLKNWITNNDIESDTTGWSTYDDAGAFVDGTGGSPTTVTISRNTTTPLDGTGDLLISKAATDGSGEGTCVTTDTIGRVYRGDQFNLEFRWDGDDANNTDTDWEVKIYDIGGTAILSNLDCVAGCNADGTLPKKDTKVHYNGIAGSSMSSARICFHLESDSATASAVSLYVDEIRAGPDGLTPGSIQEIIGTVAVTDSWANSTTSCEFTRFGPDLDARCRATVTGAGATNFVLTMPTGYTIDTTNMSNQIVGQARLIDTGTSTFDGTVVYTSSTSLTVGAKNVAGSYGFLTTLTNLIPFTWINGDFIDFNFKVPIVGWTTGGMLSSNEVSLKVVTVTAKGNDGQVITASTENINFTVDTDLHGAWSGDAYTGQRDEEVIINGSIAATAGFTATLYAYVKPVGGSFTLEKKIGLAQTSFAESMFSGQIDLKKGEELAIRSNVGFTLSNSSTLHTLKIQSQPNFRIWSQYINGTVTDDLFRVKDDVDQTKQLALEISGLTTGTTRTQTVQDVNDVFVYRDTTDTLTNKTLTSPAINSANSNYGTASNSVRILLPNDTTTNLDALTDTKALIAYDTTLDQVVVNDSTGWNAIGGGGPQDPTLTTTWIYTSDEFEAALDGGTNMGVMGWDCSPAGGSSSCTHTTNASGEENRKGLWKITHDNGAGNRASIYNGQVYKFNDGEHRFGASVKLNNSPTASEDFIWNIGFNNNTGTLGAYLTLIGIDRVQNATNFICITDNNSTPTYTDTGVAFDTSWHTFQIKVNAAGTSITFYIDGSLVCTHTTDIPTVALRLFLGSNWVAGVATRSWDLDFVYHALKPDTARGTLHEFLQ